MNGRELFYQNNVSELIVDKQASILVCGGGDLDKNVFRNLYKKSCLGFKDLVALEASVANHFHLFLLDVSESRDINRFVAKAGVGWTRNALSVSRLSVT